jgi:hypothetical protein
MFDIDVMVLSSNSSDGGAACRSLRPLHWASKPGGAVQKLAATDAGRGVAYAQKLKASNSVKTACLEDMAILNVTALTLTTDTASKAMAVSLANFAADEFGQQCLTWTPHDVTDRNISDFRPIWPLRSVSIEVIYYSVTCLPTPLQFEIVVGQIIVSGASCNFNYPAKWPKKCSFEFVGVAKWIWAPEHLAVLSMAVQGLLASQQWYTGKLWRLH